MAHPYLLLTWYVIGFFISIYLFYRYKKSSNEYDKQENHAMFMISVCFPPITFLLTPLLALLGLVVIVISTIIHKIYNLIFELIEYIINKIKN